MGFARVKYIGLGIQLHDQRGTPLGTKVQILKDEVPEGRLRVHDVYSSL